MLLKTKSNCAWVSTLQRWHPYLQPGNVHNSSLPSMELHSVFGPVSYMHPDMAPPTPPISPLLRQVKERILRLPPSWDMFHNVSSQGNTCTWPPSAVLLDFNITWFEEDIKHSSQWAQLRVVRTAVTHETMPFCTTTDSWAAWGGWPCGCHNASGKLDNLGTVPCGELTYGGTHGMCAHNPLLPSR